jgi:hypothetical protein
MALSRRAAEHVVGIVGAEGPLMRRFERALIPEESFIHTVIGNHPTMRVADCMITWARFQPGATHPDTLTAADRDEVLAAGVPFARKFDNVATLEAFDAVSSRSARRAPGG